MRATKYIMDYGRFISTSMNVRKRWALATQLKQNLRLLYFYLKHFINSNSVLEYEIR